MTKKENDKILTAKEVEELEQKRIDGGAVCTCTYYPESCAVHYDTWFLDLKELIMKRRGQIGIYKANKRESGSVAQFEMSRNNDCMFLEMAKQHAPMDSSKPYDWDNKIIVKLGHTDICKILAFFSPQMMYYSRPPEPLKLFHQNDKGSKGIELKWQEREWQGKKTYSYYLTVSSKVGDADPLKISVPIGLDEVEYLKVGFAKALELILGWDT